MDGYKLEALPIGSGTFGNTFKAIREEDEKEVCIKISNDIEDEADRKQMEQEFELISQIKHENIIEFYSSFWMGPKFCIVLELADGNLREKIEAKLNEHEIIEILVQILFALQHFHSQKIIHRNIKLENILLKQGQIKIAESGFTKTLNTQLTSAVNLNYLAPETFSNEKGDITRDIWSVGVIIYLLAAQKFPLMLITKKKLNYTL